MGHGKKIHEFLTSLCLSKKSLSFSWKAKLCPPFFGGPRPKLDFMDLGNRSYDKESLLFMFGPRVVLVYSLSVRSFRPWSFWPDFRGESFCPNFGGLFRPTLFYIVFR